MDIDCSGTTIMASDWGCGHGHRILLKYGHGFRAWVTIVDIEFCLDMAVALDAKLCFVVLF